MVDSGTDDKDRAKSNALTITEMDEKMMRDPYTLRFVFAPPKEMDEKVMPGATAITSSNTLCFTFEDVFPNEVAQLIGSLNGEEVFLSETYPNVDTLIDILSKNNGVGFYSFS